MLLQGCCWWIPLCEVLDNDADRARRERVWREVVPIIRALAGKWCWDNDGDADEADAVGQAVAVKMLRHPATFSRGLRQARNPTAYLACAVRRTAVRRRHSLDDTVLGHAQHDSGGFVDAIDYRTPGDTWSTDDAVGQLLRALSLADQELLHLRFWDGLSVPAIAERLGLGESAVKMRVCRLLTWLRELLAPA